MNRLAKHILKSVEVAAESLQPLAEVEKEAKAYLAKEVSIKRHNSEKGSADIETLGISISCLGGALIIGGLAMEITGTDDMLSQMSWAGGIGLVALGGMMYAAEKVSERH